MPLSVRSMIDRTILWKELYGMDLLKTLLVYMAVLVSSSATATPAFTPAPPGAYTPAPTIAPTAITTYVPATITPQTATPTATSFTTLYVGDRGDNVRTMQLRLKELNYLTGAADGIFGQQTRRAVERFQYYNKLTVDGIAGPKTLNKLYNDPNVVIAPVEPKKTPEPTATPKPQIATMRVPVNYFNNAGELLTSELLTLQTGRTTIYANPAKVPTGYTLTSPSSVTVTVSANGVASPSSVSFTYRAPATPTDQPIAVNVPVYYRAQDNTLLTTTQVPCYAGQTTVIYAQSIHVPAGYTLVSAGSFSVSVSAAGIATPTSVTFTYKAPAPIEAAVPVHYQDTKGTVIHSTVVYLAPGNNTITANDSLVPGYTLQGTGTVTVSVSASGVATPRSVLFTYKAPPAAVTAKVTAYYKDQAGKDLGSETFTLPQGANTITANDSSVPAGYTLVGERNISVVVSEDGTAAPSSVTFTYKAPVSAMVSVAYQDTKGNPIHSESITLKEGTSTVTANDANVPADYTLVGERNISVAVSADGTAAPSSVTFTYKAPVSAVVSVAYQDTKGNPIHSENITLREGTSTVTANDANVSAGYTLKGERNVSVTVDADGTATPSSIVFTYQAPVSVTVAVIYRDEAGADIASDSITAKLGKNTVTANDSKVEAGYILTSARNVEVTVTEDEKAVPDTVIFTYKAPVPPVSVNVPVVYLGTDGAQLNATSALVSTGSNTVSADSSMVPAGYILTSAASVTVIVSPEGATDPAQVTFTYRAPTPVEQVQYLPKHQTFSLSGGPYEVYTGPGTSYYRAGGNATVGGGKLRYYGSVGEWALIGYGLSNGLYRIGYVTHNAIPADITVIQLNLSYAPVTTTGSVYFTDDPVIGGSRDTNRLAYYDKGGVAMHLLAYLDDTWAYVEIQDFKNGQPARAFVVRRKL
ncbi:MAG: peptidoglycan-binding protein [Christensenellales bacterium]